MIKKLSIVMFLTMSLYGAQILGKIDKFDLPALNLNNLEAKLDTGSAISSLHCISIKPLKDGTVRFVIRDKTSKKVKGKTLVKKIYKTDIVESANGTEKKIYFVKTPIIIYGKEYSMKLALSYTSDNKYPLTIGRELIKQGFLIDVTEENLSYKHKNIK